MFNIGWGEFLILIVAGLVILGPERLPSAAAWLGRTVRQVREYANGAHVYTDGCWAGNDGSDPIPIVSFEHDVDWMDADGRPSKYGEHGEAVAGLAGTCRFGLEDGRRLTVEATGSFARPYEPFQRGGLNLMTVTIDDGRTGTAIYEVTGARHRRFFPDTFVEGLLPA